MLTGHTRSSTLAAVNEALSLIHSWLRAPLTAPSCQNRAIALHRQTGAARLMIASVVEIFKSPFEA